MIHVYVRDIPAPEFPTVAKRSGGISREIGAMQQEDVKLDVTRMASEMQITTGDP